ncbi:MAG: SpoIIE family protein phosphatase [Bacteroidales bacterium]
MKPLLSRPQLLKCWLLWLVLLALTPSWASAQQLRVLSEANQERVARLEELITLYLNQNDLRTALGHMNRVSFIYWENGRPDKALESFARSIPYYERINDFDNLQKAYSNMGLISLDLEDVRGADQAFTSRLAVQRRMNEPRGLATALIDLAYVKNLRNDHREAIRLLEEAMEIALRLNIESLLPNIYNQLANSFTSIGNVRQGDEYRKKYNDIREFLARQTMRGEFQEREFQSQVEARLSQEEAERRQQQIIINQLLFERQQDSITLIVREREQSLELARLRQERQESEIRELEQAQALSQAEIARQEAVQNLQLLIIYSVLGGLGFVLILVVFVYRGYKAKKRSNKQLEAKNIEIQSANEKLEDAFVKIEEQNFRITQSISYAREIQKALFPPQETLNDFLPEAFIFFKPVDMVSGDFYWFREIQAQNPQHREAANAETANSHNNGSLMKFNGEKFIISAVDCTGHGVPGAFMSMIGYNLLDSITSGGTSHADKILDRLHKGVRRALKQEDGNNQDGMDMSLCVINKKNKTVEFAGANNPILYIQNDELTLIKGDRMPIGGSQRELERKFTPHVIKVDQPTWFYILTDGYTDQFGGDDGRKFLMKNFRELIQSIYTLPMPEQRQILADKFKAWKGEKEEQIDDVLVIGFKLD